MKFLATLTNLLPMLGAGNDEEGISSLVNTAYDKFKNIINIVLPVALGVVLLVGTVYAIILGVRYSKAEDADKREEAKKHLVGAIVGFLITLVLIAVVYAVLAIFLPDNRKKVSLPFEEYQYEETLRLSAEDGNKYTLRIGGDVVENLTSSDFGKDKDIKAKLTKDLKFGDFTVEQTMIDSLNIEVNGTSVTITLTFTEDSVERKYSSTIQMIDNTTVFIVGEEFELVAA